MTVRRIMSSLQNRRKIEKIKIRFRTAHNDVEEVHILTGNSSYPMWKIVSEGEFDFYEIEWQLSDVPFSYLFEVKRRRSDMLFQQVRRFRSERRFLCVYDRSGIFYSRVGKRSRLCIRFLVGSVFGNGDPTNDVEDGEYIYIGAPSVKIKDWSKVPAAMDIRNFLRRRSSGRHG